ncbi:MAG: hypothetical protein HZC16_02590 [Candidatus Omnitrophica bacterium]|nr:hypothetical protein [Candidatus Omnitrophota bacterium]
MQFSYKLDDGQWSDWSISTTAVLSGLSDGAHAFSVKARDEAGNEDPTPAEARFAVDTTSPVITFSVNPSVLWPANGQMINVTVSGNIRDSGSGPASASYNVNDEYGQVGTAGAITASGDGSFSFTISLKAERDGKDIDGRIYTVTINASDKAGNFNISGMNVTVPHDMR